ncbi:MAG: hypothetical protein RLY71_2219 [Pseudomonadota bacterium]|jgi:uncharacterized LabA/DUF88 family protein
MNAGRIAILVDGGFFLKRLARLVPAERCDTPANIVGCIRQMCRQHIRMLTSSTDARWQQHVYRIFFYDAQPYDGKAHHPVGNRPIDYARSDVARHRLELFELLRKERKLALRLGKVTRERDWTIAPELTKKLLRTREALAALDGLDSTAVQAGTTSTLTLDPTAARQLLTLRDLWRSLDEHSVSLGLRQKGVDMRIGVDIASLTLKKQVDTIILVAGDSDFVPAAKLARREGIEFILDPLWQKVNPDLFEHIDGLQSGLKRPGSADEAAAASTLQTSPGATTTSSAVESDD